MSDAAVEKLGEGQWAVLRPAAIDNAGFDGGFFSLSTEVGSVEVWPNPHKTYITVQVKERGVRKGLRISKDGPHFPALMTALAPLMGRVAYRQIS